MSIWRLLLGIKYYHYAIYDTALRFFDNSDTIHNDILYQPGYPDNQAEVFRFLQSEGLVEIDKYGVHITEKGKCRRNSGFVRELVIERVKLLGIVLSTIVALITLIRLCL